MHSKTAAGLSLASLLIACVALSGCGEKPKPAEKGGGAPPAVKAPKTLIGVLLPLTGENESKGKAVLAGLKLAVRKKGAAVGLDESLLEVKDYGEPPSDVLALARNLVDVEGVSAVVGPLDEKDVEVIEELARQKKVPVLTTAFGPLKLNVLGSTVYRLTFTAEEEGAAMAELGAKKLFKSAAVLVDGDMPASVARAKAFAERFARLGGAVVSQVQYSTGDKDFRRTVRMAAFHQKPGPDVFYLTGAREESAAVIEEMKAQKVFGAALGSSSWDGSTPFPAEIAPGFSAYAPCRYFAGSPGTASADFARTFKSATQQDQGAYEAFGYDAGLAIIDALSRSNDRRDDVADKLAAVHLLAGATGSLTARQWSLASQVTILRLKGTTFEFDSTVDIK